MRAWLALVFAGALGCGPTQPTAVAPTVTPAAPTLHQMVDAMCACTSPACADQVRTQLAGVDKPGDTTPHTVALHDYLTRCEQTAREGDEVATLTAMEDGMCACKDARCADKVQHDYKDFWQREIERYGGDRKPTDQIMKIAERETECETRAREGDASQAAGHGTGLDHTGGDGHPAPAPGAGGTGVPACDAYLRAVDNFASCDKVTQQMKDAIKQGADAMISSLANIADEPAEAKAAAADACKQAMDALGQASDALGCPR